MDESFDPPRRQGSRGVYAVAGLVGDGVSFFELERRWRMLRQRSDINIQYFKASECERGSGEFAKFLSNPPEVTPSERLRLDSLSLGFIDLIANPVKFDNAHLFTFGLGIVQQEFEEVLEDEPNAPEILGKDPYRLAYHFAMIQCAWGVMKMRRGDRVAFVCDQHEVYSPQAAAAYLSLKDTNPNASAHMGTFSYKDDKSCEQLQAADAVAFEVRRALNHALQQWSTPLRKQYQVLERSRSVALTTRITKKMLHNIVKSHNPGEPFRLDVLMQAQRDDNVFLSNQGPQAS